MKQAISHPSAYIKEDDVKTIRDTAAEAEHLGLLHPDQLAIVYRENWFKLLVPSTYGGRQIALPDLVRLQEAISWADGSTGWVVTLCSGAGWFGGFISPQTADQIFKHPQVCLAGSGAVGGTAEVTAEGYIINGTWKYASGAHHATHITANCAITKNGEALKNTEGEPLVLPFVFDKADVNILPAWKYIGMVATGSDAFEIKNLLVARDRQYEIDPAAAIVNEALHKYPFLQLAEATLAVNISGMAIHFMDQCEAIFLQKIKNPRLTSEQKAFLIDELSRSTAELDKQRTVFFEAVDQSWIAVQYSDTIPDAILNKVSSTSRHLARLSRKLVDGLYPLCGLIAASPDTEINRAWRDLHTASQHALLTFVE
jgi:alkylation response protein AidB-like acyl-CoA dehydrogenase